MSDIIKITCTVERIRFYKNEWGIVDVSIDKVKEGEPKDDGFGMLVLKGNMPKLVRKDMYNVTAKYVEDPKWGDQYEIISIFNAVEFGKDDNISQKRFLASIFTPLQVSNMYEVLDNPFETLKNKDAKELVKVKNCGMKTANQWIQRFSNNISKALIFTELENYNLTNNMVNRLMKRYASPELVVEKVKNNPYILCNEVKGIGWKKADQIALDGGIEPHGVTRISAYIYKYLDDCGENGCSWITPDELIGAILDALGDEVPDENITDSIHNMEEELWWNEDKTKIGLRKYYDIEYQIAQELIRLRDSANKFSYTNWEDVVKHLEHKQGWNYTEEQKIGIKTVLDNNIALIQGYAGTGKSTLVTAMIEILKRYSYVQCALSGRASSRMAEITGEEGYTIHRLLGYPAHGNAGKNGFEFHDENMLPYDIVIVDEISMVDAYLFYYLLRALPDGTKLICLGDPGQLESIGCGNIAHDIICSSEISTVSLTQIHRQAAASAIITDSIRIRKGQHIIDKDWVGREVRGELQDLSLECFSDASNTYYKILQSYSAHMAKKDFDVLDTQVIVPLKTRGMTSTYELNNAIQSLYNPNVIEGQCYTGFIGEGKTYFLKQNDKVINVSNNYKTNPPIYNGNIGILKCFEEIEDESTGEMYLVMTVDFKGIGTVHIKEEDWNSIELGYAITAHKSQGSQWNNVLFGLDFSAYALLTRELVYTVITRAQKNCELIAQTGALRMAVGKEGVSKKQTHLQQCLYEITHPKLIF